MTVNQVLIDGLRRAIAHLRDVADGVVAPDAHTARLIDLSAELGEVLRSKRAAENTLPATTPEETR